MGVAHVLLVLLCRVVSIVSLNSGHHALRSLPLKNKLFANPVTSDGSSYRSDITESEAFLWFDEAMIHVRAGSGGAGSNTFKYGLHRQQQSPFGGSGGDGGSVVFGIDDRCNTLLGFRGKSGFRAENGKPGGVEFNNGLDGEDFYLSVPVGTVVINNSTGVVIGELTRDNRRLVVARGGIGGKGNGILRTK